jgi:hypothetical protein
MIGRHCVKKIVRFVKLPNQIDAMFFIFFILFIYIIINNILLIIISIAMYVKGVF